MIVCSCSLITAKDVADAVAALRTVDPLAAIKPGSLYRRLGIRPPCGGCGRLVKELMAFYDQECLGAPSSGTLEDWLSAEHGSAQSAFSPGPAGLEPALA